MHPDSSAAPPDAIMTMPSNEARCWFCVHYSFKVFAGDDETQGKCFRDFDATRGYWWVDGNMTCPQFKCDTDFIERLKSDQQT